MSNSTAAHFRKQLLPILVCPTCRKGLSFAGRRVLCPRRHSFEVNASVPVFTQLDDYLATEAKAWEEEWQSKISKKALKAYRLNMSVFKKLGYWEESSTASNLIPSKAGDVALDLGCGNGVSTSGIKGSLVVGLDLSEKELVKSKKKYPRNFFVVGDARRLPFKSNSFDLIVAINMLHHVENPDIVLKECFRVLKKGGKILTVDPNLYNPVGFIGRGLYKLLRLKRFFPSFPQFALGEEEYQFSKKAYHKLFARSAFKDFVIKPHRFERFFFFASILLPLLVNFPFYKNILSGVSRVGEFIVKIPPFDNICYFWKGSAVK